ncbi:unnamed protein product [Linum trigynum]|uniref:Uncharacterized protein n=1 Tax=Linum trigynum TaxID=586398 RepID=A0AAV2E1S1_9ROSI
MFFCFRDGSDGEAVHKRCPENADLMWSSLCQVDTSVLHRLPEELRVDLVGLLPAHRNREPPSNAVFEAHADNAEESSVVSTTDNESTSLPNDLNSDLMIGHPPKWVEKFRISNCLILNSLAEMYYKWGPTKNLSPLLLHLISECVYPLNEDDVWGDEASCDLCTLLKLYIKVNLASDMEEIYVCFRLLRRLGEKSKLISQVYNIVLPDLQVRTGIVTTYIVMLIALLIEDW